MEMQASFLKTARREKKMELPTLICGNKPARTHFSMVRSVLRNMQATSVLVRRSSGFPEVRSSEKRRLGAVGWKTGFSSLIMVVFVFDRRNHHEVREDLFNKLEYTQGFLLQ